MEDDTKQSAQDFSWNENAASVLVRIDIAFALVQRPAHFTDVDHCFECRDHDEELSARPGPELRRSDLGSMCWDPITFSIPQGVAYLMPTLARYTMGPDLWATPGWYAEQMAFHLTHGEQGNRLLQFFDDEQRAAVSAMIDWMIEERVEDLKSNCLEDDWLQAGSLWRSRRPESLDVLV